MARKVHMIRSKLPDGRVETYCLKMSNGGGTGRQVLNFHEGSSREFDATENEARVDCGRCLKRMEP